jgi:hypothetical protein
MPDWLDVHGLRARRGGSTSKARAFLASLDGVWPRVRTVRSKRGHPHREVHAADYERLCAGLGPPPEAREAIAA